ncbi:MAG: uL15 family ribosomal protein [Clostridia bacterium]|nr:uL15 family ribosomal protein [Clostridia bacterium]
MLFVILFVLEGLCAVVEIWFTIFLITAFRSKKPAPAAARTMAAPVAVAAAPAQEEEEPLVLPEIVDHIDAEHADEMLSDRVAMAFMIVEEKGPKTEGERDYVNIGDIDTAFEAGEEITLARLQERGMVSPKIKRVKILADGMLTKAFTVRAHSFSIQAVKMIELTGGTVIKIR